jgi:hypothetical protein
MSAQRMAFLTGFAVFCNLTLTYYLTSENELSPPKAMPLSPSMNGGTVTLLVHMLRI